MQISSSKPADVRFRKVLLFICPQILYYLEDIIKHEAVCCGSEVQNGELLYIPFQC